MAALTALCVLVGILLSQSHDEVRVSSLVAAGNIASAVSQDVARNIELLDLALQGVTDAVADSEVMAATPRLQRLVLFDRTMTANDIDAILVLDEQGNNVIDSRSIVPRVQRFGSSDFFRAHVHQADRGLFISRPFLSPFDGEWSIALSRRLARADGTFFGVAAGIVKLDYFNKLFNTLNLGPRGVVSLTGLDGTILMRHPYDDGDIGRVLNITDLNQRVAVSSSGHFQAPSMIDGLERLYVYQKIGLLPIVTLVGASTDDLFAAWREKAAVVVGLMILFCGAIVGLVGYLQRELGRRIAAEAAYAQLAATDKLTGLPNRRKFDEILDSEWLRSRRSGEALSLLMIDVDHFKSYNDRYGHLGGDAMLATFGQALLSNLIRTTDFAARYGGEEFAVVLPVTDAAAAASVAERIRSKIDGLCEPHSGSPYGSVSVSIGVASLTAGPGQSSSDLVALADMALYDAKAAGRNRVMVCAEPLLTDAA